MSTSVSCAYGYRRKKAKQKQNKVKQVGHTRTTGIRTLTLKGSAHTHNTPVHKQHKTNVQTVKPLQNSRNCPLPSFYTRAHAYTYPTLRGYKSITSVYTACKSTSRTPMASFIASLGAPASSSGLAQSTSDALLAPFAHVCSLSGKGIRSTLIDGFNEWCRLPTPVLNEVKVCIDMLHNASLLIDDIEDNSSTRRGAPAAHCIFGVPLTLNCANQIYFLALQKILSLPALALQVASCQSQSEDSQSPSAAPMAFATDSPGAASPIASSSSSSRAMSEANSRDTCDAASSLLLVSREVSEFSYYSQNLSDITLGLVNIYSEEMICLHEGQGTDILWRDTHQCPSLDEYNLMVMKKTGGLFRLALRIMMALAVPSSQRLSSGLPEKYISLAETMGVFFQTLDDYLNVSCEQYHLNKSFCEDLTEGKFSYPIIHSILVSSVTGDNQLLQILKQRPTDVAVKQHCMRLMDTTGSLEATRNRVENLRHEIYAVMESVGGSQALDEVMQKMCKLMGSTY